MFANYNYRTPETNLLRSKTPGIGTDYTYGERAPSMAELEQLVKRRQEMLDCQREVYMAESNCRGLNTGTTFALNGHADEQLNGDYLVVSLQHEGNQSSLFAFGGGRKKQPSAKTLTYHNALTLLKKDTPYRPVVDSTRRPQMAGGQIAKTETSGGDYAYLDDAGRYRIKLLFEDAAHSAAAASHPVRMMQALAGPNYGIHRTRVRV